MGGSTSCTTGTTCPQPKHVKETISLKCTGFQTLVWSPTAVVNCQLLQGAVEGDVEKMKQALEAGADVNVHKWPSLSPVTAIRTDSRDEEMVMDMGSPEHANAVDMKCKERDSRLPSLTPLMYVARDGCAPAVEMLVSAKANLLLKDSEGMQPLHFAATAGCADCVSLLIGARADLRARDDFGRDAFGCLPPTCTFNLAEKNKWKALLSAEAPGKVSTAVL
eukprot:TRINITY_DN50878_c0_g1_i1.p1 TRINITY_DN50878_c0_g1~~TRINITY_DN50878_c0_g1_i1.p1  ORF type:complete len:221 (-),score=35.03 TRINITY_DN50878_c0_g1_i1:81-743(-)